MPDKKTGGSQMSRALSGLRDSDGILDKERYRVDLFLLCRFTPKGCSEPSRGCSVLAERLVQTGGAVFVSGLLFRFIPHFPLGVTLQYRRVCSLLCRDAFMRCFSGLVKGFQLFDGPHTHTHKHKNTHKLTGFQMGLYSHSLLSASL